MLHAVDAVEMIEELVEHRGTLALLAPVKQAFQFKKAVCDSVHLRVPEQGVCEAVRAQPAFFGAVVCLFRGGKVILFYRESRQKELRLDLVGQPVLVSQVGERDRQQQEEQRDGRQFPFHRAISFAQ